MKKLPVNFLLDLDQVGYITLEARRSKVSIGSLVRRFINENKSKTDITALSRYFTDKESHSHAGDNE